MIDGTIYHFGNPSLFGDLGVDIADVNDKVYALQAEGKTVMLLGADKKIKGIIAVADRVREHAKRVIESLHAIGLIEQLC